MPSPYISEIRFQGGANLDFIEVAVDPGTNVSAIQVVVYNANGTVRSTNALGALVNTEAGRDIYVIDTATSSSFTGLNRMGAVALVENGTVTSFYSFNNTVTATQGPANGQTSTQLTGTAQGESLETSDNGASYQVQPDPTPGNVPCFVSGTLILGPRGPVPVDTLRAGDLVQTADAGLQPVLWAGQRILAPAEQHNRAKLPIRIPAGALAPGVPSRDLLVSPNHRMALEHPACALWFHADQVLAPAKALTGRAGIGPAPVGLPVRYHHILLGAHQIVWANGAPAETLHLARMGLEGFCRRIQARILATAGHPRDYGPTARMSLKPDEARLLIRMAGTDDIAEPRYARHLAAA